MKELTKYLLKNGYSPLEGVTSTMFGRGYATEESPVTGFRSFVFVRYLHAGNEWEIRVGVQKLVWRLAIVRAIQHLGFANHAGAKWLCDLNYWPCLSLFAFATSERFKNLKLKSSKADFKACLSAEDLDLESFFFNAMDSVKYESLLSTREGVGLAWNKTAVAPGLRILEFCAARLALGQDCDEAKQVQAELFKRLENSDLLGVWVKGRLLETFGEALRIGWREQDVDVVLKLG